MTITMELTQYDKDRLHNERLWNRIQQVYDWLNTPLTMRVSEREFWMLTPLDLLAIAIIVKVVMKYVQDS